MNFEELLSQIKQRETNFIIITGGVCSSIGKGVLTSSIGVLLKDVGYTVSVMKCDPYLNVDPGTMSPLVHGEVFVTDDGAETDLDLGHYERMIGVQLSKESSVSAGQVFQEILNGEREGTFLGRCIQLVPHVVDAIKRRLLNVAHASEAQFILVEIGGTVGDIEGEVFLEAIRQLRMDLAPGRMLHCHLSYVPYLTWANEVKTKPTQHSVMLLKKAGLVPDALFLRTEQALPPDAIKKISIMCGVRHDLIFQNMTRRPIYQLFLDLYEQGLSSKLREWCKTAPRAAQTTETPSPAHLSAWRNLITLITTPKQKVTIGMVVKYIGTSEPYISVIEAIKAAGYACHRDVELVYIDANSLELSPATTQHQNALQQLATVQGIVVPGGFDRRGVEGKIVAAQWAREHKIPYLGLCLGLQVLLIEIARNVAGIKNATSMELDPTTSEPVIALLNEQNDVIKKGGTMRLGLYPCSLTHGSIARAAYGKDLVEERHRHRYEFNNAYKQRMEAAGVLFSGINQERNLVEIAELQNHPFMLGTQAHPEFLSRPLASHPLFFAFIQASCKIDV